MNLSGKWKIKTSVNETTGKISYRTNISTKDMEGNSEFYSVYINLVGDAKFKPIDNDMFIIVKPEDAWLSFFNKKEGGHQMVAVVKNFEYENESEDTSDRAFNNQIDSDDSLPF